jgi:hypothetical protein
VAQLSITWSRVAAALAILTEPHHNREVFRDLLPHNYDKLVKASGLAEPSWFLIDPLQRRRQYISTALHWFAACVMRALRSIRSATAFSSMDQEVPKSLVRVLAARKAEVMAALMEAPRFRTPCDPGVELVLEAFEGYWCKTPKSSAWR